MTDKTIRRNTWLAERRRSRDRESRLSVVDTLGVTPSRDKTVNLHEVRELQVGCVAATSQDEHRMEDKRHHGKTKHSYGRSQPSRDRATRQHKYSERRKAKSAHGTPRPSSGWKSGENIKLMIDNVEDRCQF